MLLVQHLTPRAVVTPTYDAVAIAVRYSCPPLVIVCTVPKFPAWTT